MQPAPVPEPVTLTGFGLLMMIRPIPPVDRWQVGHQKIAEVQTRSTLPRTVFYSLRFETRGMAVVWLEQISALRMVSHSNRP